MASEIVELELYNTVSNIFKVPRAAWRRWSPRAHFVFNQVYGAMTSSMWAFQHLGVATVSSEHFKVTAYNAAWIAADAVMDAEQSVKD